MKKVLIISWYFRPCSLTPSQRVTYWVDNFQKHRVYPIIVTRAWDKELKNYIETKRPFGRDLRHEKHDNYEVIYVPFKPGLVDWAYLKFGESKLKILFFLAKLIDTLTFGFTWVFSSHKSILKEAEHLVGTEDFDKIIISGEPFQLFKIGWIIKNKFNINWIADYRDDWTTNELQKQRNGGFVWKMLIRIERYFEKKWVQSASVITSVSDLYTKRIADLVDIRGVTVENGFDDELLNLPQCDLYEKFTIMYSGNLYPNQDISIVFGAVSQMIESGYDLDLIFLGSGYEKSALRRLQSIFGGLLDKNCFVTTKIPRVEALKLLKKSHVLLSVAYGDLRGIPSSKLYEYIGLGKPILLCPGDGDVMQSMVVESGLGFVANNQDECMRRLKEIMSYYENNQIDQLLESGRAQRERYRRANHLKTLSELI